MLAEDQLLLECLEDIHYTLEDSLKRVQDVPSALVVRLEQWADELKSQRRIFEEISSPARLIVEHLIDCQNKRALVALESGHFRQAFATVRTVRVEEFGIIRLSVGGLDVTWRDKDYSYYFYPDKIELRATDEKSAVKIFFSLGFSRQTVEKFTEILHYSTVVYVHPQLEKWLNGPGQDEAT